MSSAAPLALLAATELVMLWILSSAASRGQGLIPFVAGLALLAATLEAFRRGARRPLYALWFVSLLATVAALAFEALLASSPGLLKGRVADVAYSGYHWQRGGIYDLDPVLGPVMRPSFARPMYWNGHRWRHETNAAGYRGPLLARADAVFLGDSMIYGHGVEEDETVAAAFSAQTGESVANLGVQGTCVLQSVVRFLDHGRPLRPRRVFLCVHPTDVEDALHFYGAAELRRVSSLPLADGARPRVLPEFQPPTWRTPVRLWAARFALPLRCSGIAGALVRALRERALAAPPRDPFVPTQGDRDRIISGLAPADPEADRTSWEAQRHAVAELARAGRRSGARLVLFDIGYPDGFSAAVKALAAEVGATYSPAGRAALDRALAGERVYLPNDGHWTPLGSRLVAEALAAAPE